MPYVNIKVTPHITREQKEALVKDITDSLQKHLNKPPELTHVVIDEIEPDNWGFNCMLTSDYFDKKE